MNSTSSSVLFFSSVRVDILWFVGTSRLTSCIPETNAKNNIYGGGRTLIVTLLRGGVGSLLWALPKIDPHLVISRYLTNVPLNMDHIPRRDY